MLKNGKIRMAYERIQSALFYMIPEKWDKVYLYASVFNHYNSIQTGEMFFYYYPKSVFKKNPVNVYEVPDKFNIDEKAYLKLAEKLYEEIKNLRIVLVEAGEKEWTNLTICIQNFNFNVEYRYDDLVNSKYTNYDRHLAWRYKYLGVPLNSYSKKDRKMIEEYLQKEEYENKNITTYSEGIYKKPVSNITEYDKEENNNEIEDNDNSTKENTYKSHILTKEDLEESINLTKEDTKIKSQILKY